MRRGFTLLEVLIAITIFVMAVAAILPLMAVGSAAHRRGMEQTEAALMAAKVFARLQEDLVDPNPSEIRGGVLGDSDRFYTYDADFSPLDPQDASRAAFAVRVRIRGQTGAWSEEFEGVLLRKLRN